MGFAVFFFSSFNLFQDNSEKMGAFLLKILLVVFVSHLDMQNQNFYL